MQFLETSPEPREGWLESWAGLLRRRWLAGVSTFSILFALAAVVVLFARPIFRAQARLRLGEPPPMTGVSPTAGIFGLMRLGGDPFANDMEVIDSRTLTEHVIADASLNAKLIAPRGWHRDSLFTHFQAGPATERATWELEWQTDGNVAIRMIAPRDSTIGTVAAAGTARFGDMTLGLRAWREGAPRRIRVRTVPVSLAVLEQRPRIVAERSRRDANIVDIQYDGDDPAVVRQVVGSVIDCFIALRSEIQRRESGQTVDSLRVVADSTSRELKSAESALEEWERQTRLVQPELQGEAFFERYSLLVGEVEEARYELDAIVSIADRIDASPDTTLDWLLLLTHPKFLENETIGSVLAKMTELQQRRAELLTRRAGTSREVQLVDEQIRELDGTLRSLVHGYRTALARKLEVLEGQAARMDAQIEATPAQAIELGRRQRSIRLLSEIIVLTEQRLRQEEMRQALTFSNIQVIDPPALRWKPVWPRKKLGLAAGFMIASAFGLLAVVVAERADRTLRRAREIEELAGAPILAVTVADRRHLPALTEGESRAVARFAGSADGNGVHTSLAAPGRDERAVALVRALAAGNGNGARGAGDGEQVRAPSFSVLPPVEDFASASAAEGGPVVLVVRYGRTRRDSLSRSIRLLRTAGATIAGTIVVCERERQRDGLWT